MAKENETLNTTTPTHSHTWKTHFLQNPQTNSFFLTKLFNNNNNNNNPTWDCFLTLFLLLLKTQHKVCVCVCVWERERERESLCVSVRTLTACMITPLQQKQTSNQIFHKRASNCFHFFFSFPLSVLQNPPTLCFFFGGFTKESNTTTGEIDTLADSSWLRTPP